MFRRFPLMFICDEALRNSLIRNLGVIGELFSVGADDNFAQQLAA